MLVSHHVLFVALEERASYAHAHPLLALCALGRLHCFTAVTRFDGKLQGKHGFRSHVTVQHVHAHAHDRRAVGGGSRSLEKA